MMAHAFPADPTLEALRVQRDAYAASGGEAAVIFDKLRDELVVAKQRLFDQEKALVVRIDDTTRPAIHNISQEGTRHDEGAAMMHGDVTIDGVPLDEADQQSAIPTAEPSTVP
jgi:hypothetical protein